MKQSNQKIKRWSIPLFMVLLTFVGIQFIQPPADNPPENNSIKAPLEVIKVLRKACYDCHSNESRLSWYDQLAPASWLFASDVERCRAPVDSLGHVASSHTGSAIYYPISLAYSHNHQQCRCQDFQ